MKHVSDIHQCSKSKNKIICMTIDKVGVTRCGYCNEVVDMTPLIEDPEYKKKLAELLNS